MGGRGCIWCMTMRRLVEEVRVQVPIGLSCIATGHRSCKLCNFFLCRVAISYPLLSLIYPYGI
ncbi:hypothetical protein Hanom_Chr04g00341801 [Helianthus anomalus]